MRKLILAILNAAESNNGQVPAKLWQKAVNYTNTHPMWEALNPELAAVWRDIQASKQ